MPIRCYLHDLPLQEKSKPKNRHKGRPSLFFHKESLLFFVFKKSIRIRILRCVFTYCTFVCMILTSHGTQEMVTSPKEGIWTAEMRGGSRLFNRGSCAKWYLKTKQNNKEKKPTMNGNVSLHGARKWFASGAYALQGVQKSPELARSEKQTDCWLQGIPKDSPPPPCFLRSSCGSAWLFHFARLLQTSPVNKLPCHPGRLPASL